MNIIYNFKLTKEISLLPNEGNRAFQYGDGLFETIIYQHKQIRFLPDHVERLTKGAEAFYMQLPNNFSLTYLQEAIHTLVQQNGLGDNARVRIHVWRKPGGTYTPVTNEADFCITAHALAAPLPPVKHKVFFYEHFRLVVSPVSRFKTCNSLPYVMAGIAKTHRKADDMILLDVHGHVAECIASNIFWLQNGQLFTPSLEAGCIEGIMRKHILVTARDLQIVVHEGLFTKQELLNAEAVFCCNVSGLQIIHQVEETIFKEVNTIIASLINKL